MAEAILRRMARLRMFGRSPVGAWLRLNEWIWNRLPPSLTALGPFRSFGHLLHSLVRRQERRMYLGTFFLRNRPELELLRRLSGLGSGGRRVRIAVRLRIKPGIREGIVWHVADAADPRILETLGPQDIVVANRFLCHMGPLEAESCIRNIARLLVPGGYLFVSGVDLDVRTKVAIDLGWKPVQDLLQELHEGDPSLRASWPHKYWGLEPLDRRRSDWKTRYASVFQIGEDIA